MTERPFCDDAEERADAEAAEPTLEMPPAMFSLIYESRDGKMCLFEDADGHITAVRAARLA